MGKTPRGKRGSSQQPPPCRKEPRNTVTLCLDGSHEEVVRSYLSSQLHLRYWNLYGAERRVRVGQGRLIYTTRLEGTFFYAVTHNDQWIVFVIDARQYWVVGFLNSHGFFQFLWADNACNYLDSDRTKCTGIDANHKNISPGGVGKTRMGVEELRGGFRAIADYEGPGHVEPHGFRHAIGRFVVYIMESKYGEILRRCQSTDFTYPRLGDDMREFIVNWERNSTTVMNCIATDLKTQQLVDKARKLIGEMLIYYADASFEEIFGHAGLLPKPRKQTWSRIDDGEENSQIPNLDAVQAQEIGFPSRAVKARGRKRGRGLGDLDEKEKRGKRLKGGGLGGCAAVPPWFAEWNQLEDDQKKCENVVSHARKLGLIILERPPLEKFVAPEQSLKPLQQLPQDKAERWLKDLQLTEIAYVEQQVPPKVNKSQSDDIEDLIGNRFISDSVIEDYLPQLHSVLEGGNIHMVRPSEAILYARRPATINPAIFSHRQLIFFPVNNAINFSDRQFEVSDVGDHWSLLILDATTSRPQFRHLDSSAHIAGADGTTQGMNGEAARRLADALRQVLPGAADWEFREESAPTQQTQVDCGIYVMAFASAIARWWNTRNHSRETWTDAVRRMVTPQVVNAMRTEAVDLLLGGRTILQMSFFGEKKEHAKCTEEEQAKSTSP